jgi:LmbE family N-acetylglucosaminyl deacetylase
VLGIPLVGGATPVDRVLALGAHADDIEIGCGGTLLALTRARPEVAVTWVVLGAEGEREREARASAEAFLASVPHSEVFVHPFQNSYFPYVGGQLKDIFEELKELYEPDLILTHTRHDLHQDHRLTCELTWNTWRDHLIFEYEIPKYDGDLGNPNLFFPISEDLAREKVQLIRDAYPSQGERHWFDEQLFLGLMRVRGMEGRAPSGYAEAFTCRKLSLRVA